MEVSAKAKYLRITPRRLKLVADMVRGKKVNDAVQFLKFTNKKGAKLVNKALGSAIANAEQTKQIDVDTLFVKKIMVDSGPIMKRFLSRAQGRADRVNKRTSHLTVVLEEK